MGVVASLLTLTNGEISKDVRESFDLSRPLAKKQHDQHYRADVSQGDTMQLYPRHRQWYDPDVLADQTTWDRYVSKGRALMCAMRNSDKFAGEMLNDARSPASAASVWQGDLTREFRRACVQSTNSVAKWSARGTEDVGMARCSAQGRTVHL